jgi:hypothetical protein
VIVASAARARAVDPEKPQAPRRWAVAGAGFLSYGVVPQVAPGIELQLRRSFGEHAQLRAGLLGAFAFDVELEESTGTFDAKLLAGRVDGCGRTALASALRGAGCFGLLGGALHVSGDDVMLTTSSTVPWLALSAAAGLDYVLSPSWSLELGLSAAVLLHRVEVGIEDTDGASVRGRRLSPVSFVVGFGPVYNF